MNPNLYNNSGGDPNFYDRDDYTKLLGSDSDTFKELLPLVDAIMPEQDSHLLTDDTSLIDMCSSFDRRMDFSGLDTRNGLFNDSPQLPNDSYYNNSLGATGGYSEPMTPGVLPNLSSAAERRRPHKMTKKRANKHDRFAPPDNLFPDSNRLPEVSEFNGYSPYSSNLSYEDNYREDEVPVININDSDQFSVISFDDYGHSESHLGHQPMNLNGSNNILYSAIESANLSPGLESEDFVSQNYLNNSNFSANIDAEDNISQASNDTEQIDHSQLSDAEKYRRLRDLNNKASREYRNRQKEKLSEIGNQIPELEEKNRILKNKSQKMESLRNEMLQHYNRTFNTNYQPQQVLYLKR